MVVSGSCFGWVTPILDFMLGPDSEIPMTSSQSSWMVAIIELGNIASPIPASFMADRWGRKPSILLTGPLYFLSWVVILVWPSVEALYTARILQGLAMGIVYTVVPLYLSEISRPELRGSITSLFHNSWYLGHLVEYSVGPLLPYRAYTYVTATLPVISFFLFYGQPETPYFLLMKKKEQEASKALGRLRGTNLVNEELETMTESVRNQLKNRASWREILRTSGDRRSLYIVVGLGAIRVLNGLIAIMTYSTVTFSKIRSRNNIEAPLLGGIFTPTNITILFGIILFVSSFFVTLIADLSGRRVLLMCSCLGACVNLFLAGSYFFIIEKTYMDVSKYSWFPVVTIILFSLFVTLGLGPVSVMYQSEMFLTNTRGFASSISAINITVNAFFILKFYQVIADSVGVYFVFWLFSSFCLLGSFWIYFTVPETRGKTFDQIRKDLNASMKVESEQSVKSRMISSFELSDPV